MNSIRLDDYKIKKKIAKKKSDKKKLINKELK